MTKVLLFAMGQKGLHVLQTLHQLNPTVLAAIIYAEDPSVAADYATDIQQFCSTHGLDCYSRKQWSQHQSFYTYTHAMAISWRWMIQDMQAPLVVMHDSLLPKYRGFNPLVTALIEGDTQVGVTALYASDSYDEGDIIAQSSIPITYPITIREAIQQITVCYQQLTEHVLNFIQHPNRTATPQNDAHATYSLWRDEQDYFIDWNTAAERIKRQIDATGFPYLGARTHMDNQVIVIRKAQVVTDVVIANRTPGKIIFMKNNQPVVVCQKGLICIEEAVDEHGHGIVFSKFRQRFV